MATNGVVRLCFDSLL